ncbi:MAG: four helix bundle protein [Cyclobacteriaceae bacterium]|nr:four helix bundle protein [Cyclobacteriaceae bacterium HetDA_MAG_MS6]
MRKFKDLEIWQLGKKLAIDIYKLTNSMPKEEVYGMTSQMRRAAVSIPSNISEGCSRRSNKEFAHYLEISLGSSFELETQLIITAEIGFLHDGEVQGLIGEINLMQKKINSFVTTVRKL